jgi:hypothetical protein
MKLNDLIHKLIRLEEKVGNVDVYLSTEKAIRKSGLFGKGTELVEIEDPVYSIEVDGTRIYLLGENKTDESR